MKNGKEERVIRMYKIRDIACCINKSKLCFERQVEGEWIRHVTVSGGSWSDAWVDVRTHEKRYAFCQDNPDDIYCEVDPEGDALVAPHPPNCGDRYCTAGDCEWRWDRSPASDSCYYSKGDTRRTLSISAYDGSSQTCTIETRCNYVGTSDDGTIEIQWVENEFSAELLDFDDLDVCENGIIEIGPC